MTVYAYIKRKENPVTGTRTIALTPKGKEQVFNFLAERQLDLTATGFRVNRAGEYTAVIGGNCSPEDQVFPTHLAQDFNRELGHIFPAPTLREARRYENNDF